jgi:hypothetical protein
MKAYIVNGCIWVGIWERAHNGACRKTEVDLLMVFVNDKRG